MLVLKSVSTCSSPVPLLSVLDYSPKRYISSERKISNQMPKKPKQTKTMSKWAQFVDTIDIMPKEHDEDTDSTPDHEKKDGGFFDFFLKKEHHFEKNTPSTSSFRMVGDEKNPSRMTKSLASSPRRPILKCFDLPKLPVEKRREKTMSPTSMIEENLIRFMATFPKRRSSTPSTSKPALMQKRISKLRESGARTDSEHDEVFLKDLPGKRFNEAEIICDTPENIIITKTAPSVERFRRYSSSSSIECEEPLRTIQPYRSAAHTPEKFSLIDYQKLPSTSLDVIRNQRRDDRFISQNVYVTGKIVRTELAGAASDSDSEISRTGMLEGKETRKQDILARIESCYVEDPNMETGAAGELVEEVAEENKSLLWFLLKQARPGMDLSKVVLPTFILEPRSFLDKLSDNYYHADILAEAVQLDDPYLRFKAVLRWYLSGLYRKPKGLKKPYNPVLGEVFRCYWKNRDHDSRTYYVAEQVSHHPPVSAFYVSNRKDGYVIEGSLLARSKFYGTSTSAILEGCARVHLLRRDETYVTTAPYAHCKGIVLGTLSMELGGKVHIICAETGYHAEVEFKLRSFLGSADQTNAISGRIKKGKDTIATVDGYWDGKIDIKEKKTGEESNLLDVAILKEQRMVRYLMKVEHQLEYESQRLWIKVSEAIQNNDQVAATEEKTVIEEAQRDRARNLVAPWVPRFFHKDLQLQPPEGLVDQGWRYNHVNISPWQVDEQLEYEESFVISTLRGAVPRGLEPPREPPRSDSDSREESRPKTTARTLKQTLYSIDSALREHTSAIEKLSRTVETLSEGHRQAISYRPQNVGRVPHTNHSWDLFGGFVLAIVLQALLNWLFYQKD